MKLFDPKAYDLHHKRAERTFQGHAFLFEHIANELTSRLHDLKKNFKNVLSLSPYPLAYPSHHHAILKEKLPFPNKSFDLIIHLLQAHWINDLPGLLKSIHQCLQPEGLFLGALWGGQTLHELRECLLKAELSLMGGVSSRMPPLLHPADSPLLLSKGGFFMPVVDTEVIKVTYPSLTNLIKDLRGMGETNKLYDRPKTFTSRKLWQRTEEIYQNTFGNSDGKIPATFEVIYLTGWREPISSPLPLRKDDAPAR